MSNNLFHLPYYHIRKWSAEHFDPINHDRALYDHLVNYQESTDGAIILNKDIDFVYILLNPTPELKLKLGLDSQYSMNVSSFITNDTYIDLDIGTVGKVDIWRVEEENKPGGSGLTGSLQKPVNKPGQIVSTDLNIYDVYDSEDITDPKDLIQISDKFIPYLVIDGSEFIVDNFSITATSYDKTIVSNAVNEISGELFSAEYKALNLTFHTFDNQDFYLGKVIIDTDYGTLTINENGTYKFTFLPRIKTYKKNFSSTLDYTYRVSYIGILHGKDQITDEPITSEKQIFLDFNFIFKITGDVELYSGKTEEISKDIYGQMAIMGKIYLQFPAGRLFSETVNSIVPSEYIGIPGYGASSDQSSDVIIVDPYSIDIETKSDNVDLVFRKQNGSEFVPNYKNGSLILDNSYAFDLTINNPIDKGVSIKTNFYFPINREISKGMPVLSTKIEDEDLNIYLVPKNGTYEESIENETTEILQEYFFYLTYGDKSIIYCSPIKTNTGYTISFIFEKNNIEIAQNNAKFTVKIASDEQLFDIEDLENTFLLFDGFSCLLKFLQVYTYTFEIESPFDYFIDYKMIDFYQLRNCNPECPWALKQGSEELQRDLYVPKKKLKMSDAQTEFCPGVQFGLDPFTNQESSECTQTTLIPINVDYPLAYTENIIQSPHYKIAISVNHEPFSSAAVINESQCKLLYSIFESGRPVSRVSHYTLGIEFNSDFSGEATSLYKSSNGANGETRCTITREIMEDSEIFNAGEEGFDDKMQEGEITHSLKSTEIIAQSFNLQNRLMYPSEQYALDDNNYIISFAPNKESGYALLKKANSVKVINQLLTRPFYILTSGQVENAVILQLQNENNYREELKEFNVIGPNIRVDLLELFDEGKTLLNEMDKMFYVAKPSKVGNIKHDLGLMGVIVQVYDKQGKAIKPSEVVLIDKNTLQLQFATEISGTVGILRIGNPNGKGDAIDEIVPHDVIDENGNMYNTSGYLLLGDLNGNNIPNGNYGEGFNKYGEDLDKKMQSTNLIKANITEFYETQTEYIFIAKVPAYGGEDLQIREIGVFNSKDEMCFYSIGHLIYVIRDFELEVTYRIVKK